MAGRIKHAKRSSKTASNNQSVFNCFNAKAYSKAVKKSAKTETVLEKVKKIFKRTTNK